MAYLGSRDIRAEAGSRLESSLQRVLDAVNEDPASLDPVAGYACLYVESDYPGSVRARSGAVVQAGRVRPAFVTKFLYFSTLGALILDNRLANAVHMLGHLPQLVTGRGRSLTWTPYRHATYLHWMTQTAQMVGVGPELLELTLFQPPGDLTTRRPGCLAAAFVLGSIESLRLTNRPLRPTLRLRVSLANGSVAFSGTVLSLCRDESDPICWRDRT